MRASSEGVSDQIGQEQTLFVLRMSWQTCSHQRGRRGIDFKVNEKWAQCGKSAQMALRSAKLLRSGGNRIVVDYRETLIQEENINGNAACTATVIGRLRLANQKEYSSLVHSAQSM